MGATIELAPTLSLFVEDEGEDEVALGLVVVDAFVVALALDEDGFAVLVGEPDVSVCVVVVPGVPEDEAGEVVADAVDAVDAEVAEVAEDAAVGALVGAGPLIEGTGISQYRPDHPSLQSQLIKCGSELNKESENENENETRMRRE